jgi:hypothetical protein
MYKVSRVDRGEGREGCARLGYEDIDLSRNIPPDVGAVRAVIRGSNDMYVLI